MENKTNVIENGENIIRFSERGIPLIYMYGADKELPILTAELYCKWYTLYLINPDGSIEKYDPYNVDDNIRVADNLWHPDDIREFVENNNLLMDELFYEILVGRWVTEVEERY